MQSKVPPSSHVKVAPPKAEMVERYAPPAASPAPRPSYRLRDLLGLSLLLTVGTLACSNPSAKQRTEGRGSSQSSSNAVTAPAPSSVSSTRAAAFVPHCRDDQTRVHCAAATGCEERCSELCLAGRCLRLRDEAIDRVLTHEPRYRPGPDGWINAWNVLGPLQAESTKHFLENPKELFRKAPPRLRSRCAPEGYVAGARGLAQRAAKAPGSPAHELLFAYLVLGRRRNLQIRLGARGNVHLYINEKSIAHIESTSRLAPFRDAHSYRVDLDAGVHRVVVVLRSLARVPAGFWLRFSSDNAKPTRNAFRWLLPHEPRCDLGALTKSEIRATAIEDGFEFRTHFRLHGLYPTAAEQLPVLLQIRGNSASGANPPSSFSTQQLLDGTESVRSWRAKRPQQLRYKQTVGKQRTSKRLPFHGDLHNDILQLKAAAAQLPSDLSDDSRASFRWATQQLVDALEKPIPDRRWLKRRLRRLQTLHQQLADSKDAYARTTGVLHRAYRSPIDGRLQKYIIYIPPSYRRHPKRNFPMMVAFHGLGHEPALALRIAFGLGPDENEDRRIASRHLPPLPDLGTIVLAPNGYGSSGPRQLGEADVLATIKRSMRHYRVDPRRISITGYSLGGTVATTLPLHYPSLFSAAAPLCGYPNLLTYRSVAKKPKYPWEKVMLQKRFIGNSIANGRHIPLHLVHGGRDGPHRSAIIAKGYRRRGYRYVFDLQEDLGHNVWDHAYENGRMLAWLRARRQPKSPRKLSLHTGELRYGKNRWLQLHELPPTRVARIDVSYEPNRDLLVVSSSDAEVFSVDREKLQLSDKTRIRWNNQEYPTPTAGKRVYFLSKTPSGNQVIGHYQAPPRHKRPNLAGPLDDVLRHPALIVWGSADPEQSSVNRLVAQHFQSFDSFSGALFPMRRDTELSEEERKTHSLILIGNGKSNTITRQVLQGLPLRFFADGLQFRGKRYSGRRVGVSLIHPSPFSADEYIVLHAGVTAEGTRSSRHLARLSPDFVVYDDDIRVQRGEELLHPRKVLAGGFFDNRWR